MRPWFIIGIVLLAAVAVYFVIHSAITREVRTVNQSESPELVWLQREYQLTDEQFAKVQKLHRHHDAYCRELCKQLVRAQQEFSLAFVTLDRTDEKFEAALRNWREQHELSQDAIISHAEDISRVMTPEQGDRYKQRVFNRLLLPGRTPHIDAHGKFDENFVRHLEN